MLHVGQSCGSFTATITQILNCNIQTFNFSNQTTIGAARRSIIRFTKPATITELQLINNATVQTFTRRHPKVVTQTTMNRSGPSPPRPLSSCCASVNHAVTVLSLRRSLKFSIATHIQSFLEPNRHWHPWITTGSPFPLKLRHR